MSDLTQSPLASEHRALGARMASFAGWEMPISYAGTVGEHTAVRTTAGVFDVSHLGKILVQGGAPGEGAVLLDRALTNVMTTLEPGRARYTLMLDDEAGIVDDMIVYGTGGDLLVVPNASNVDEVERRIVALRDEFAPDVKVAQTDDAILALQGPRSREILDAVLPGVPDLGYMHIGTAGAFTIARSGYTGEHGYEIFAARADAPALWRAMLEAGATPAGLAARDTLRLEMGYPLHGSDIDRTTTPAEAGLMWAVGKSKTDFAGAEAFRRKEPARTLVGIRMTDRAIPRHGCAVLDAAGGTIGEVTSGTFSPTLKIGIALAYVASKNASVGEKVIVDVRGKHGSGEIVRPPFVTSSPKA